jgi:two-component system cell cycle sensor histidine kinase/response regulator CckA
MDSPFRILIVGDLQGDVELVQREVDRTLPNCVFEQAESREEYLGTLEHFRPDLIISGYHMPRFDGMTALQLALLHAPLTPVIILTGAINEDMAVECMKAGATDYVIKEHIKRLGQAVSRALIERRLRDERRRAEEALRASEARFRSVYENATIGLYRTTPDGRFLTANQAAVRSLGYSSFEALAQRNLEQDGFATEAPRSAYRAQLDRDGVVTGLEGIWIRYDRSTIVVRVSARAIRDEQGVVRYYDGAFEDITEQKRLQEALQQQLLQFQKMESIGRLAGGVAHDFNNLLTVIQGYCDLIEVEMPREAPLLEELGQIRLASQRAAALTGQLLAFSRKQILSPSVLALNDLLANVRKMLERLIGEDITLMTTLEPNPHPVIADHGQIEQVIMNLVINARDAMPRGGTLIIETDNVDLDQSYAITHPEAPVGPCVLLTVTDTGYGMDELTQARIFEPFFTTKEPDKGIGLGLATVYGIIKQSGGEITVTSQPDHGTTFQILLPASTSAAGDQADSHLHAAVSGGSETILLVEDDALVRDLMRTVLRNEGYTILEAAQGHEALAIARQHRGSIDLLVTDVVMPQMSGRELAEQLSLTRRPIKVLFISGYTDDAVVRHGLLMARIEFLSKPFSPMKLAAKVREVLDKASVAEIPSTHGYYKDAHGVLTRTLDVVQGAANTRSFAQAMVAQGNMLGMMGDLAAASAHFARGHAMFQALGDRSGQASLLERLGWIAREQGDAARALAWLEEGLVLSRKLGDRQHVAWLLLTMAEVAILQEDAAGAEALIEQGTALNPESHDWIGWSLNHQGHAAQLRREYGRAQQLHQKSLAVFHEQLGEKSTGVMWAYQGLGETALGQGDSTTARKSLSANLQLSCELGARIMIAWCLAGLGSAAALDEEPGRAARLWGASKQVRAALGCRPAPAARATYERLLTLASSKLGEGTFAAAWAAGEALSPEQAIAEALGDEI